MNDEVFELNIQFWMTENFVSEFDRLSLNQRRSMTSVAVNMRASSRIRYFSLSRVDENDQRSHHSSRFERFERSSYINVVLESAQAQSSRKVFILNQLERVRSSKIISITQQLLDEHIDRLYDNQHDLQHRFESLENIVKYEVITKNDIIELRDDFNVLQNIVQNCFSELMIKMNKINIEFESSASLLMIFEKQEKSLTKAEDLHQNRSLSSDFLEEADQQRKLWNRQNSISLKMAKKAQQNATDSQQNRLFSLNDLKSVSALDRMLENNEVYNQEHRDRLIARSQAWRRDHESRMSSQTSLSIQFENRVVIVKSNQFKSSDFDFFYLWYSKDQNSTDYVIDDKKTIYINVHMFVETVRRFIANKNILEHLHLCLKNAAQIWYIALTSARREVIMRSMKIFCFALITRYEDHSADSYAKLQIEQYTVRDAQKRRQSDEYVSLLMRHVVLLDMFELVVLTKIWSSLNKKLRKHVRRSDKNIIIEEFTRNFEDVARYYASDINKENSIEIAYQCEVKSTQKQIQNSERFDRYSESYFESYSTNYLFRLQDSQSTRNSQTSSRNSYLSSSQYASFSQRTLHYSQQNQISTTQNSSSSQRISQYSTRSTQYSSSSSNQKLLTNNVSYNAFISSFYEQYDNHANNEYEKKQSVNENIKYETLEIANFDDIIIFFHAKVSQLEQFNDEEYTRHDMTSLFCNMCKKSYVNNDDRVRLNNHMFNIHDVDIKSNQTMNRKRYINWMKHAALHVVTIRESSSKREYVIIQTRLYDENNEEISICIDTDFSVNFIDETLLSEDNLWSRLHNCHSIIVRDIANERIVDKQMNIFLYITTIDESLKRLEVKTYVNKDIQADVIFDMNKLKKIENDIVIWLDKKKMQLNNCHVTINFTSRDSQSVIFFANATSRSDYTDRESCIKSFDDKCSKKSVRFAEITIKISYKSILFSDSLS